MQIINLWTPATDPNIWMPYRVAWIILFLSWLTVLILWLHEIINFLKRR